MRPSSDSRRKKPHRLEALPQEQARSQSAGADFLSDGESLTNNPGEALHHGANMPNRSKRRKRADIQRPIVLPKPRLQGALANTLHSAPLQHYTSLLLDVPEEARLTVADINKLRRGITVKRLQQGILTDGHIKQPSLHTQGSTYNNIGQYSTTVRTANAAGYWVNGGIGRSLTTPDLPLRPMSVSASAPVFPLRGVTPGSSSGSGGLEPQVVTYLSRTQLRIDLHIHV